MLGLAVGLAVSTVLVVGAGAPADAVTKKPKPTSVTLTSITHVATAKDPGPVLITGDDIVLRGKASANLVGRTVRVQVEVGRKWVTYISTATVSKKRAFSVRVGTDDTLGKVTFRAQFVGSSKLKASTGTRSADFHAWFPLVNLTGTDARGSMPAVTAPHPVSDVEVGSVTYPNLLAGTLTPGQSGAVDFVLGKHCTAFYTTIGIADTPTGPGAMLAGFEVDVNGAAKATRQIAYDSTSTFGLSFKGAATLTLQVRDQSPIPVSAQAAPLVASSEVAGWPDAKVLCDSSPTALAPSFRVADETHE